MWWKIVEARETFPGITELRTLFHGNKGSRLLKTKTWVHAAEKIVHDGNNGTPYTSGWHVIPTREEAYEYLDKFKKARRDRLIVVRVWVKEVHKKEHSPSPIYLARWIYIGDQSNES